MRRRLSLLLALSLAVLVGVAVSSSLQDSLPPELFVDVPEKTPAGMPFQIELSADEPVVYEVSYAEQSVSEEAQTYTPSFIAAEGLQSVTITATDAADNVSEETVSVVGIGQLIPTTSVPEALIPGEALSITTTWAADGPQAVSVDAVVGGESRRVVALNGLSTVITSIPLGTPAGPLLVELKFTDEYGRVVDETKELEVLEYPQAVQELNLSGNTLSVVTPEGRELERKMIDAAYTYINERPQPLWSEPFILPIQGVNTSGFGSPRRYARGGNVSYHNGADIGAPQGTPILATNAGRVLVADTYPIKGGFTLIDHGAGLYSYYLHQSAIHVEAGQSVERAQHIGDVGSTGLSTGPHLHWEMRLDGNATNPLNWVGKVKP